MQTLPKIIIAIPIVILILAFFLKIEEKKANNYIAQIPQATQYQETINPLKTITSQTGFSNKEAAIDLTGPYVCTYKNETSSVDIQIQNRQIYGKMVKDNKENYVLVKGDCAQIWEKGKNTGLQICEISQYLSLFDMASSFISPEVMFSSMLSMAPGVNISEEGIKVLVNSCQKAQIDEKNFISPGGIVFQTK